MKCIGTDPNFEGTDNERICATGIYYFESEVRKSDSKSIIICSASNCLLLKFQKNIEDPCLNFRIGVDDPENYAQGEHDHVSAILQCLKSI